MTTTWQFVTQREYQASEILNRLGSSGDPDSGGIPGHGRVLYLVDLEGPHGVIAALTFLVRPTSPLAVEITAIRVRGGRTRPPDALLASLLVLLPYVERVSWRLGAGGVLFARPETGLNRALAEEAGFRRGERPDQPWVRRPARG
jgi:hypothetical protein